MKTHQSAGKIAAWRSFGASKFLSRSPAKRDEKICREKRARRNFNKLLSAES